MTGSAGVSVRDHPDAQRFEVLVDDAVAGVAAYELDGGRITFTHTEVGDGHEGQGLASRLVTAALDAAAERGLEVVPACSFVRARVAEEPDRYLHLVPEDVRAGLGLA